MTLNIMNKTATSDHLTDRNTTYNTGKFTHQTEKDRRYNILPATNNDMHFTIFESHLNSP